MDPLLLLPVVIAVATPCAALFAAALAWHKKPETPNERRAVDGSANLLGIVIAVAGFLLWGLGDAVVRAVPGTTLPQLDRTFLGVFVAFAASVPVLVGPGVARRTVLDGDALGDALCKNVKGGISLGLIAPLGVVALIVGAKSPFPPAVALVPPVLAVAYSAASGLVAAAHWTPVPPSEAPTDAVDRAIERTGFDPDRVCLVDADRESLWRPFAKGIGRCGWVFVPLSSFERYDDDVLETLLLLIIQKSPFRSSRILTAWGVVGVAFALLFGGEFVSTTALGVGFLALLVLVPAAVWGGRRIVFRHDAEVAAAVGAGRVVDAFVAQDEQRGGDSPSTLALLLRMTPALEERVERLGGDAARLPSSDAGQDPTPGPGVQPRGAPQEGPPPRESRGGEQRGAPRRDPQRRESPPPEGPEPESRGESPWEHRDRHARRGERTDGDRDDVQW